MKNYLQEIYDSEINFKISTFWDGGFYCGLGLEVMGFKETFNEYTFEEAVISLSKAVIKHYPESDFAIANKEEFGEL